MLRPLSLLALSVIAPLALAQQLPIATVPTEGVTVAGSLEVANGKAVVGNNGSVTAGDKTAVITLTRGGELLLCASTTLHLTTDSSIVPATGQNSTALMMSLDRGAMETSYTPSVYSDVLLTPDFRILISGPGKADLKLRVNQKGDTCIDNHGDNAPYVTVTSQFEGGVYRVKPNQRVLFEHGSLQQVVDNETEPCGCPPVTPIAIAGKGGQPVGGPSSTPADTAFPLAESEGLKPPPPPPAQPVVPPGTPHAQVTAPLVYNGATAPSQPPPPVEPQPAISSATPTSMPQNMPQNAQKSANSGGFFHHIGRFFAHLFGG